MGDASGNARICPAMVPGLENRSGCGRISILRLNIRTHEDLSFFYRSFRIPDRVRAVVFLDTAGTMRSTEIRGENSNAPAVPDPGRDEKGSWAPGSPTPRASMDATRTGRSEPVRTGPTSPLRSGSDEDTFPTPVGEQVSLIRIPPRGLTEAMNSTAG